LGPFGEDSDLRCWGKKLSARGGKNAKKRAVVAVARKLAPSENRSTTSVDGRVATEAGLAEREKERKNHVESKKLLTWIGLNGTPVPVPRQNPIRSRNS
jgi:hypothetical protein